MNSTENFEERVKLVRPISSEPTIFTRDKYAQGVKWTGILKSNPLGYFCLSENVNKVYPFIEQWNHSVRCESVRKKNSLFGFKNIITVCLKEVNIDKPCIFTTLALTSLLFHNNFQQKSFLAGLKLSPRAIFEF